jgi:peptidoglycan hydrolase-like protein with peptidoglycan-binding domain
MTTHVQARALASEALTKRFKENPLAGEVKALAGIGCLETRYGDGWKGAGLGSNNMGAEQCGNTWKADRFIYIDTHPNADGTSKPYRACFRKYSTPDAGWFALVDIVYVNRKRVRVRDAAQRSDWAGVSKGLYVTGYYEGFGKTSADRISNHLRSLTKAIAAADNVVAPVIPVVGIPDVVLRRGTRGEAVKLLQRELRLAADGLFGAITEAALRVYQTDHGLLVDGICGPKTWAVLFADDFVPEAA